MKIAVGLMMLLAVSPVALFAQSPEARIEAARERLVQSGIDVRLIDVRIAEGRAKGAAADVIARVVENRTNALINSAATIRPVAAGPSQADLAAGADALEAGIPAGAIQQIVRQARAEDRSVALSVLTYLHREQSLPLDTAIQHVTEALQRGPQALRELPAQAAARANAGGGGGRPPSAGAAAPGQQGRGGPPSGVPGPDNSRGRGNSGGNGNPRNN